jgi:hypothetical protein
MRIAAAAPQRRSWGSRHRLGLIAQGFDVNRRDRMAVRCLAAEQGHKEIVSLLVKSERDDARSKLGQSAWHHAIERKGAGWRS